VRFWARPSKMAVEQLAFDAIDPAQPPKALRPQLFASILDHVTSPGATLLDLGAGACKLSMFARDLGYRVTAVDARAERVPEELGSIEFVQSDIREFDVNGYDVVCVLGLFYHLTLEDQLDLLARCDASVVILDTQLYEPDLAPPEEQDRFSEAVERGPYRGVLFNEAENQFASWGNELSFWHTERSLITLIRNVGCKRLTVVSPYYASKLGMRRFYVLR
jgi:hypothetical protein